MLHADSEPVRGERVTYVSAVCAFVALLVCCGGARADNALSSTTGKELLESCRGDPGVRCYAYIQGVVDTVLAFQQGNVVPSRICLVRGVATKAFVDVVVKYLEAHPETLPGRASDSVIVATIGAWPCKQ